MHYFMPRKNISLSGFIVSYALGVFSDFWSLNLSFFVLFLMSPLIVTSDMFISV